ncbi:hypothetical protein BDZ97DRAFT_65955 [Flammula alnicola]|nr:hypothetical protein BDZ97DRAFT_65955 [Flammula alnicola]
MSSRFLSLGLDVLVNIMHFLPPRDIIRLRRTCRDVHSISFCRIIWLDALSRTIEDHNLFKLTYDLATTTNAELEHAALCPSKLISLARKSHSNALPLQARSHRVLVNWQSEQERWDQAQTPYATDFADMLVIPGSRFILTVSDNFNDRIYTKLWDLGQPGSAQSQIPLVATLVTSECTFKMHATSPTPNGLGIRLVSSLITSVQTDATKLKVYEIFPLSSSPIFKEIGSINVEKQAQRVATSGDRVICSFGIPQTVLVWDFTRHLFAIFRPYFSFLADQVSFYGDYVVLCHMKSLSIWEIPPLEPYTPDYGIILEESLPILEFMLPFNNETPTKMPPHDGGWNSNSFNGRFLVALGFLPNRHFEIALFRMEDNFPSHNPLVPRTLPVLLSRAGFEYPEHGSSDLEIGVPQICDNTVILTCIRPNYLLIFLLPIPEERESRSLLSAQCLLKVGEFELETVQFCPATGRACLLSPHHTEIRVVDYSLPAF